MNNQYIVTNNSTQRTWSFNDQIMAIAAAQLFDRATVHETTQGASKIDPLVDRLVWAR